MNRSTCTTRLQVLACFFGIMWSFSWIATLVYHSSLGTPSTLAVIVCGQPDVSFAQQLSEAANNFQGTTHIFVDDIGIIDDDNSVFSCFGRSVVKHVQHSKSDYRYDYIILLPVSVSSRISSPQTLFQYIANAMKTADVIGISAAVDSTRTSTLSSDNNILFDFKNSVDDKEWWTTGRPVVETSSAYSNAFNNREWEASYAAKLSGTPKLRNKVVVSRDQELLLGKPHKIQDDQVHLPCWLLRRNQWRLNIIESPTLSLCDAVGTTLVIRSDVLYAISSLLWSDVLKISNEDVGFMHLYITLKRRFHQRLKIRHVGSLITHSRPMSIFDKHPADTWFTSNEGTRKGEHDTKRQKECVNTVARLFDVKEILSPSNQMLDVGCSLKGHRCAMNFVQRGLPLPPCCRRKLIGVLSFMSELLSQRKVLHWLDYGSLLGAVRHHGKLVPWEYDADLTVFSGHWQHVLSLEEKINNNGYYFHLQAPGHARVFASMSNAVYIDLYSQGPVEGKPPNIWYMRAGGDIDPFPANQFMQPMETIQLENIWFPCPNNPELFLQTRYGSHFMNNKKKKKYDGPQSKIDPYFFGPDPGQF